MMNYQLLKEVIGRLEKYEATEKDASLEGFALFLNKNLDLPNTSESMPEAFSKDTLDKMSERSMGVENHITFLLVTIWKYAKHYIKTAFKDLPIKSVDDFGFLAGLSEVDSLTKTELIQKNIAEIPSGMEIIKRLVKKGMVEDFKDPNDGRAKRLKITPIGKMAVGQSIGQLLRISKIIIGDLTQNEQIRLLQTLEKLNHFHINIHENDWKSDLEALEEKYVVKENT
jgi:DNA-binding MarR family transcriptional regulator